MKKILHAVLVFTLLLSSSIMFAQEKKDDCYTRTEPLTIYAYKKMMRDHFNFTIMGTQSPSSGFKVETNKPTVTLKGNINSLKNENDLLVNVELTGGVQNDLMQVLAGDDVNGFFRASIGFNKMIENGNKARYIMDNKFLRNVTKKKVCEYREEIAKQIDTMLVLEGFESAVATTRPSLTDMISHVAAIARMDQYTIGNYQRPFTDSAAADYYKKLIIALMIKYGADTTSKTVDTGKAEAPAETLTQKQNRWFVDFMGKLSKVDNRNLRSGKMVSDLERLSKFRTDRRHKYTLLDAYAIETYKNIWTSKRITWLNVSLTGANSIFKLYDVASNTLQDGNSFVPSVSISYNYFLRANPANKYFYIKAGVVAKRTNSLTDLEQFNYKRETIINVGATEQLKTERSGTAYKGALVHGVGFDVPVEVYWAPWNDAAIPGLYGKLQYSYGNPWINRNKILADVGIVWNVVNNEKDSKNLLTIVPYVSWGNLVKEYKDEAKTSERKMSDLFSLSIKFGIPVNLGR